MAGSRFKHLPLFTLLAICISISVADANEIHFDEAIKAAGTSPKVKAVNADLHARKKGDRSIPGNRGSLELSVAPGRRLSPESETGTEFAVGITQGWNLTDLSGHSRKAAKAERAVLTAEVRAQALASRIEAAHRWIALHEAQAVLALVEAEVVVIGKLDAANQRARAAGLVTSVAEAEAKTAHAEAKRLQLTADGARVHAALSLSVALGHAPDTELRATGDLPAPELPTSSEIFKLVKKVDHLPEVAMRRLQSVAAQARAAEQQASRGTGLRVGLELEREASGSSVLFATFGLSFAGADKGQRARSLSNAESLRRLQEAEEVLNALRSELADAVHELKHSEETWTLIHTELQPAAEALLTQRQRQLELGEGTILEVLRARARLLEARRYAAIADAERRWAQVHLWLLLAEIELGSEGNTL